MRRTLALPEIISAEITATGANTVIVLGGTAVVSTGVESDLASLIGVL